MSVNKAILVGSVGRDPEVRVSNDAKVATFTLATNERYKDRNGEYQTTTDWHTIVCWRATAEVVEKYVKKGMQLYVEGKIKTRSWEDQNGNKRYVTEIIADNVQMLGKKEDNAAQSQQRFDPHAAQTTPMTMPNEVDDSDLPF